MQQKKSPIVIFIPEAGIYPYLRSLSVISSAISREDRDVFVTRCTGQMRRCPMMDMHQSPVDISPEEKEKLCMKCSKTLKKAQQKYKFKTIELSEMIDDKSITEIDNLLKEDDKENIKYKGFPVGKIAQFDFVLATKYLYHKNLPEKYQKIYTAYIKNISLAIAMTNKICQKYKPELLLTFSEYGEYQGARYATNLNNVPSKTIMHPMHYNADYSRFIIWKNTSESFFYPHCQRWESAKNISITRENVHECWNDIIFRLFNPGGSHIFSPQKKDNPATIFDKLKLDREKKVVSVFTSSYDERNAKDVVMNVWKEGPKIMDAFPDQISWLKTLKKYAGESDDFQVVVRIHPREGSRQFGFDSENLQKMKKLFTNDSENFTIIWPDDPISSYDLLEFTDICLVPWTLMGQEATRLGIPTISITGNMFYPDDDFVQVAKNPEDFKEKLSAMLKMKYNWHHLLKSFRFYHWRTIIPSLDLGDTVPIDRQDDTVWPKVPEKMQKIVNKILFDEKDILEHNIKKWQTSLPADAEIEESKAMRQGIRYFIDKTFFPPPIHNKNILFIFRVYRKIKKITLHLVGKKIFTSKIKNFPFKDYSLEYSDEISRLEEFLHKTKKNPNLRILLKDEMDAILIWKGKYIRRMSPMVIRLARLHNHNLKNSK